jgi:cation transport protein ChaC
LPSTSASDPVWIFAYGSLMWQPGFAHDEALPARLHGYHRALCIYSVYHRGTAERPGLVLGLDRGGSCRGWAFRVERAREAEVLAYLDARELVTDVYQRRRLPLTTARGRLTAWCYVVRRDHVQYAGKLDELRVLELVRHGAGRSGRNSDYVVSTVRHLEEMGIADGPLHALAKGLSFQATAEGQGEVSFPTRASPACRSRGLR